MRIEFEVFSGRRMVSLQKASTAQEALIEYLCGSGCKLSEIARLGTSVVSWRGAVYRAEPAHTA